MTHFHPPEVVGRGSETQLQVGENFSVLTATDRTSSHLFPHKLLLKLLESPSNKNTESFLIHTRQTDRQIFY